uniref:ATP-dependent Clp protease proteolytic subunit n=1 Tax=Lobelia heterophylla subsp. heterophylla TaxID=2041129 RepID=A0A291EYC8_9ASTR|nr:ATP-dependent protease proteolytic subunit [Lobelia heterophylla subsp. heterophylla]
MSIGVPKVPYVMPEFKPQANLARSLKLMTAFHKFSSMKTAGTPSKDAFKKKKKPDQNSVEKFKDKDIAESDNKEKDKEEDEKVLKRVEKRGRKHLAEEAEYRRPLPPGTLPEGFVHPAYRDIKKTDDKEEEDITWLELPDRLYHLRVCFLFGLMDAEKSGYVAALVLYHSLNTPYKHQFLYINSPGGLIGHAIGIANVMQGVFAVVHTTGLGRIYAAASYVLAAGSSGYRFATPYSRIMIRQPSAGRFKGTPAQCEIWTEKMLYLKSIVINYYAKLAGTTYEYMDGLLERPIFLTPEEARRFGLIDWVGAERVVEAWNME